MKKITTYQITTVALATVINLVGAQIALLLKLPIYLDSIGTVLTGAILGPVYGMVPSLLAGIISQITMDPYAIYYAPSGMVTGLLVGLIFRAGLLRKWKMPIGTLVITLPGTMISAFVTAQLFGGVTSSGSSLIVLFFRKLGMSMVASVYAVQIVTDYADRLVAVALVLSIIVVLPKDMLEKIKGKKYGQI
ncbi:substrate-specific component STY3230 of queuosine-regulated ECF transporter [Lachnospiraceae bacterium KM106-2]|nr:substrate-specific component STY3230 of queuosine-regulated ECF transporter [Lachnospiraceae bacterium KM106-2]